MTYRDGYDTGWTRFLRILQASFGLGRFLGVELRVYWITLLVLPLIGALQIGRWASGSLEVLTHTALLTVWLYLVVWTHEMGHILAARRFGIHTPLITLSPLGGVAHLSSPPLGPKADILISLAGPLVHVLWLVIVWPLSLLVEPGSGRPDGWVLGPLFFTTDFLVHVNLWLMLFNLLPFLPLDGGRILRSLLGTRLAPERATVIAARVGLVGAVGFVIFGFVARDAWGTILVVIGLSNFFTCLQEIRLARMGIGPWAAAEAREAWQGDPESWRGGAQGGAGGGFGEQEPGFLERRRARREERAAARQREEAGELEAELDRVLDRVSEVGMGGLTRRERAVLDRASKARQRDR